MATEILAVRLAEDVLEKWAISVSNPNRRIRTGSTSEYWVLAAATGVLVFRSYSFMTITQFIKNSIQGAGIILISLIVTSTAQASNLIQNGSFEMGANISGSFDTLSPGSTAIDNWTVTVGNIDYVGSLWEPSDGSRSIDLNGFDPGGIQQTFNTIVGQRYLVKFALAGNPSELSSSPSLKEMRVEAAGQFSNFSFDTTGKSFNNMGWTSKSWEFTASELQTSLQFMSLTAFSGGPALDNVSVQVVPEPLTILGTAAAIGFGAFFKRQVNKKKKDNEE